MAKANRSTQYDKALMGLRSLVLAGEFPMGSRLPETAIAERLNISRTPLRQAMARLVEERLLEKIETGGCRVATFSMDDVIDAIELRGVLEGTAARLAAERGPVPQVLAEAERVLDALDRVIFGECEIDFDAYVHLNAAFHRAMTHMAGSQIVAREVERVSQLPLSSPSAFLQGQELFSDFQESLRRAQRQHRAILNAVKAREGARAEALAREHARLARENLEYLMNGDPDLVDQVPGLALVTAT